MFTLCYTMLFLCFVVPSYFTIEHLYLRKYIYIYIWMFNGRKSEEIRNMLEMRAKRIALVSFHRH